MGGQIQLVRWLIIENIKTFKYVSNIKFWLKLHHSENIIKWKLRLSQIYCHQTMVTFFYRDCQHFSFFNRLDEKNTNYVLLWELL